MVYYGAIKPIVPVNAFSPSVYKDENGAYFMHIIKNGSIDDFEPITDKEVEFLPVTSSSLSVEKGTEPIYSYVTGKPEPIFGTYRRMFRMLVPLLQTGINDIAKLIISSFFRLHGVSNSIANRFDERSVIQVRLENFLPSEVLSDFSAIDNEMGKLHYYSYIASIKPQHLWEDFILISSQYIYLAGYKITSNTLLSYLDKEESFSKHQRILIELLLKYQSDSSANSSNSTLLKIKGLFTKDTSWISPEIIDRLYHRMYPKAAAPSNDQPIAISGFNLENNVSAMVENNASAGIVDNNTKRIADEVKTKSTKKVNYEPAGAD
jgi:hypothetical protein